MLSDADVAIFKFDQLVYAPHFVYERRMLLRILLLFFSFFFSYSFSAVVVSV